MRRLLFVVEVADFDQAALLCLAKDVPKTGCGDRAAPGVLHHLPVPVEQIIQRGYHYGPVLDGADVDFLLPVRGQNQYDDRLVKLHAGQRHVLVHGDDPSPLRLRIAVYAVTATVEESVDDVPKASIHDRVVDGTGAGIAGEHELAPQQEMQCLAQVGRLLGAGRTLDVLEFAKHGPL
jgi:hypothetical protein